MNCEKKIEKTSSCQCYSNFFSEIIQRERKRWNNINRIIYTDGTVLLTDTENSLKKLQEIIDKLISNERKQKEMTDHQFETVQHSGYALLLSSSKS